jgi:hypothetical protein
MTKINKNISEYHCLGCRCNSQVHSPTDYQNDYLIIKKKPFQKDKVRVCVKCLIKENGLNSMEEFADGTPVCMLELFCQERRSQFVIE